MNFNLVVASINKAVSSAAKTKEEAELVIRKATEEAELTADQTLDSVPMVSATETSDSTLFEAIHAVRGTGELPYWLCKAAACLFVNEELSDGELRDAIRDRGSFLRQPEAVQLIFKQCLAMRDEGLMESVPRVELLKRAYRDGYVMKKNAAAVHSAPVALCSA
jgi:hypothetical protein